MKKMTIGEFGRFLSAANPKSVILCSENQQDEWQDSSLSFSLTFQKIKATVSPDSVYLQNFFGSICLRKTKYVLVDPDKSVLGTIITVVCEDFCVPPRENRVTLIMN